jgi:glycosyltransferase involved in cell wall biosynthesis
VQKSFGFADRAERPKQDDDPVSLCEAETMSRISIAMCTYNGARFLPEQLASIAAQTRLPDEMVVCDDGSTDTTLEILEKFSQTVPFPVRIVRNPVNLGSTKNFEQAMRLCTGDLIALCDQDDIWLPDKLAVQARLLEERLEVGGVFGDATLIDGESHPIGNGLWHGIHFTKQEQREVSAGRLVSVLLRKNVVTGATLMFRASLRPLLLPIPANWVHDRWIAWMLALQSRLAVIDGPVIRYRVHGAQQIGVESVALARGLTFTERLKKGRREEPAKHRAMAAEMATLRERLSDISGLTGDGLAARVEAKRRFLLERAAIESGGVAVFFRLLGNARNYQKYENGWKPFVRDLMMVFAERSPL